MPRFSQPSNGHFSTTRTFSPAIPNGGGANAVLPLEDFVARG
jgi:hypothetical protein